MTLKIKRDDQVLVISGKDKGARGRVLAVQPAKGTAVVEGVNIIKKHQKARKQNEQGGIVEKEAPIALCKLMLVEPGAQGRAARFGTGTDKQGNKIRVLKLKDASREVTV